jgi:hypothetical protein
MQARLVPTQNQRTTAHNPENETVLGTINRCPNGSYRHFRLDGTTPTGLLGSECSQRI